MKVTIALPSNRGFQPQTFQCLCEMVEFSKHKDLVIIAPEQGYTIAENRNYCAVQACNNGSDFLLMIDDDMTFEPNILETLANNDKDICGVPFHSRCDVSEMKTVDDTHWTKCKDKTELFEAKVGTGIILIKTKVFKNMEQPWFDFEQYPNGCTKKGEDWYFCEKAKEYNFKSYIDPTLKVGHLGEVEIE